MSGGEASTSGETYEQFVTSDSVRTCVSTISRPMSAA